MISCNAVVSNSSEDCDRNFPKIECKNKRYWWFAEPQQIESSNDLMLLYNYSSASSNPYYIPPSEYTVLGLYMNDCPIEESEIYDNFYVFPLGDPLKDNVTDAGKTYSVASVESEYMESLRSSSCEYDFSRMANNDKIVEEVKLDRQTRVAISNIIQSKAQFDFTRALMSTL